MKALILISVLATALCIRHSINSIKPSVLKELKQEYEEELPKNNINISRLKRSIKNILSNNPKKNSFTESSTAAYKYSSYSQINKDLLALKDKYPHLIKLSTAQKLFDLPSPKECEGNKDGLCESYIVKLTNFKKGDNDKPRIFFSGEVHGNERVGPHALDDLSRVLTENYDKDPWIKHLMGILFFYSDTRIIYLIPTTNSQGFSKNRREETTDSGTFDPNRDFPYQVKDTDCMKTVAARTVFNMMNTNLMTLGITFHAGDNSLSWAWGSENHAYQGGGAEGYLSTESPDDTSMKKLAFVFQNAAASYNIGRDTDLVYPVSGGMEDWGYAAGWEKKIDKTIFPDCHPKTYSKGKKASFASGDQIRTNLYLVEASYNKNPEEASFGRRSENDKCILKLFSNPYEQNLSEQECRECESIDGHVSRNVRVTLSMIDMAAPYIVPKKAERKNKSLKLSFAVGGSITVDKAFVLYDDYDKVTKNNKFNEVFSTDEDGKISVSKEFIKKKKDMNVVLDEVKSFFSFESPHVKGKGFENAFEGGSPQGSICDRKKADLISQSIDLKSGNGNIAYIIVANTDQDFGKQKEPDPDVKPETHFANQRINPTYFVEQNDQWIISYYYVFSDLLEIKSQ